MLDDWILRPILTALLRLLFGVRVRGRDHYHAIEGGAVIICNHQSFLDPLLLAVLMPKKPAFAMNLFQAEKWYFRWLRKLVTVYVLDPTKPMSMKTLIKDVRGGARVVVFPEGRITTSGGIMKIYEGTSLIIEKTGAAVLPVHIDGAQFSTLSFMKGKLRQRWLPRVTVTFFAPQQLEQGQLSPQALYDMMSDGAFRASNYRRPLLAAVLEAMQRHGGGQVVATDMARTPMSYRQLFTRAFIVQRKLKQPLDAQKNVAVLLPNSLGVAVTFIASHMLGKIPCMLNFSAGAANMLHACRIANAKTVLTSRVFIEKAGLEAVVEALQVECTIFYLEDMRKEITLSDKLTGLFSAYFAAARLAPVLLATAPDDPAVVLYTSGSEGAPKGVALSHANLLANIYQVSARVDLTSADKIFSAMPVFHSFGLMAGLLLPLVRGFETFLYPSPLHYRVIPELVYDTGATVMLGTDTFLKGYARYAHPYDFWNVRFVVAGAEKLKDATRQHWLETYGVTILEGYGVTETSPVLAVNTRMQHRTGTVGKPLPGIECRLQDVPGLDKGGRLEVRGANVMLGYLKADNPGVIQPQGEWYDTGDIVDIDAEGFITILGRAKRFAKIGGEMVSLQAVEDLAASVFPDAVHAAIAVANERKGEQILLYTEEKTLTREQLMKTLKEQGAQELCLPKQVVFMDTIPRLGNGKIDYVTLAKRPV